MPPHHGPSTQTTSQIAPPENRATGAGATDRARFFINGIRSTTKGVDVIARYRLTTDTLGKFDLTAAGNYNEVTIMR